MAVVATGWFEGRRVLSDETLAAARRERVHGPDRVLPFVMGWAAGWTSNRGLDIFGPNPEAVGHYGWGGSCVWADPQIGLSAAYVMTRQSPHLIGDPRPVRLQQALYSAF
jgi:CubicO group peptidase (beta-lactamase class C family)